MTRACLVALGLVWACGGDNGRVDDQEKGGASGGGAAGRASAGVGGRGGAGGGGGVAGGASAEAGTSGSGGGSGGMVLDAGVPDPVDAAVAGAPAVAGSGGFAELPRDRDGDFDRTGATFGPDQREQPGVPKGTITMGTFRSPSVYPGSSYTYWVYVPAQHDGRKPAALMVWQDGDYPVDVKGLYRVPTVMDNLIAKGDVPVTVNLFVAPSAGNRSLEYDSTDDRYVRFLVGELIPAVVRTHGLVITDDPEGHAIAGHSSGAVAALTAAWQRPDYFRRVHAANGSFVNIRGADQFPTLVRDTIPRKPLRVFLTSGPGDINHATYGSWYEANKKMAAALKAAGYPYRFCYGPGGHFPPSLAGSLMAETLRWLWFGYAG